jgi:RNA polymerase sigma factor (sigma-70 family)
VSSPTDEELLRRWSSGDGPSGEVLFERHFEAIYRYFRHKVGAEGAELTQRTFLRCIEVCDRYRGESGFRAFLYGVARNVLREHFRAKTREPVIDFAATSVVDLGVSVGSQVAASEQQRLLLLALRTLPLEIQELVELYYWEEIGVSELAVILELPAGTVKRRLWRARRQLEAALGHLGCG